MNLLTVFHFKGFLLFPLSLFEVFVILTLSPKPTLISRSISFSFDLEQFYIYSSTFPSSLILSLVDIFFWNKNLPI